jgi:hypothetical protein
MNRQVGANLFQRGRMIRQAREEIEVHNRTSEKVRGIDSIPAAQKGGGVSRWKNSEVGNAHAQFVPPS